MEITVDTETKKEYGKLLSIISVKDMEMEKLENFIEDNKNYVEVGQIGELKAQIKIFITNQNRYGRGNKLRLEGNSFGIKVKICTNLSIQEWQIINHITTVLSRNM